jgi:hypothetical protein
MAATEATRFQINYKLYDGTLINLYAKDVQELETGLADLGMVATLISRTSKDLAGSNNSQVAQHVANALGATIISDTGAPTPATTQDGFCKHGALVWRESKPGAPKTWKGWFCPSPKGTPDQCEPRFVRG